MSRVAKKPVTLPKGVELTVTETEVKVKGPKGTLSLGKTADVRVSIADGVANIEVANEESIALGGTVRAILANMVAGVTNGFERKLELVGVGYRASMAGKDLNLSLGFSHPVVFNAPEGVTIETPTQTEILIKGADKQAVGQTAAKIRGFRPPEPYKGKGVRYAGERIIMKEAKKA
ncbi:50S ribosomal protein L6 [Pseudomarimonas arenosa]|uniref:Large ribosomal subunit protein uL6 n=1 Tax=Pseudomarimonas arenosa TaxID=2774145 RepID=A0AAW3ZPC9_9GAMM|nr:50S ribosomal protein L6 [Pseudomarimonas arenosa]MBD8527573.1 50S ribosomal protein L6 [Pseudomarimonas arenosa]